MRSVSTNSSVLIIGSGHAGVQAATALREKGYSGRVAIFGSDTEWPYHKPPLSKDFLKTGTLSFLRGEKFFAEKAIELRLGNRVSQIDRENKEIILDTGESVPYWHLILATGATNRTLNLPGEYPDRPSNCFNLRDVHDARALKPVLEQGSEILVVGGGFVGLEVAATSRQKCLRVTVLEMGDRLLSRALSPDLSRIVCDLHLAAGVEINLSAMLVKLDLDKAGKQIDQATLADGRVIPIRNLLVAIGALPEVALARAAGLAIENGVLVDETLRSSDPDISAIGDCANFPCGFFSERVRLESIQNASDQARYVAVRIMGALSPYRALPTFWSVQYDARLQMVGLPSLADDFIHRPSGALEHAIFGVRDGEIVSVETVNMPGIYAQARKHMALNGLTGIDLLPESLKKAIDSSK